MLTLFFIIDLLTLSFFCKPASLLLLGAYSSAVVTHRALFKTFASLFLLSLLIPITQEEPYFYCAFLLISLAGAFFIKKTFYQTRLTQIGSTASIVLLYLFLVESQRMTTLSSLFFLIVRIASGFYGAWLTKVKE